ncbi:uncharacterized protein [Ptychodera flava]|uniref:uncharacterized protein n=1 Tax=Ptychodera flava TaxID=63121 RepID=UPI00396A662C
MSINLIANIRRDGQQLVPKTLFCVCPDITFGDLFNKIVTADGRCIRLNENCIESIKIYGNDKTHGCVDVKVRSEVSVCSEFNMKFVVFNVSNSDSQRAHEAIPSTSATAPSDTGGHIQNAFSIMMSTVTEIGLRDKIDVSHKLLRPQVLYNDIIQLFDELGAGWNKLDMATATRTVCAVRDSLSDPMPDDTGDHYKPFSEVYGAQTTDEHRPSLNETLQSASDKSNHKLLMAALIRVQEDNSYICGQPLFPCNHEFHSDVVVRQASCGLYQSNGNNLLQCNNSII